MRHQTVRRLPCLLPDLAERFHITLWVLLVPVVTGILIARKVSSIITLFISTALAVVCMLVFQTDVLQEVAGDGVSGGEALYKGVLLALSGSTSLQASTPALTELIAIPWNGRYDGYGMADSLCHVSGWSHDGLWHVGEHYAYVCALYP